MEMIKIIARLIRENIIEDRRVKQIFNQSYGSVHDHSPGVLIQNISFLRNCRMVDRFFAFSRSIATC